MSYPTLSTPQRTTCMSQLNLRKPHSIPYSIRTQAGGFLEARFVTFIMSEGIIRDPLPWEGATTPKVIEIRGGSVLFEAGAIGGNFVNCFFVDDLDVQAVRALFCLGG